jgi:hypothetical protein
MRRFPKAAAVLQGLVDERGAKLRELSFDALEAKAHDPVEQLTVESRPATVGVIVQQEPPDKLRVVLQGFVKARWLGGKHVALDGFFKLRSGAVIPMSDDELSDYD